MTEQPQEKPTATKERSESRLAPSQKKVKYTALRLFNILNSRKLERKARRRKVLFLKTLTDVDFCYDPILPPCVNCMSQVVYYCEKFEIECKAFVKYYNTATIGRKAGIKRED